MTTSSGESAFNTGAQVITWIILILSIINNYLPMEYLNEKIFHLDSPKPTESYDEVCKQFETNDYDLLNYVTRDAAIRKLDRRHTREINVPLD
jgi:hypothetical protein